MGYPSGPSTICWLVPYTGNFPSFSRSRVNESWIGLSDAHTEGVFRWITTHAAPYVFWNNTNPSGEPDKDCVYIRDGDGTWLDARCDEQRPYVCRSQIGRFESSGLTAADPERGSGGQGVGSPFCAGEYIIYSSNFKISKNRGSMPPPRTPLTPFIKVLDPSLGYRF